MGGNREGRLRPFPPEAVIGPTLTSGSEGRQIPNSLLAKCVSPVSTGLLLGPAEPLNSVSLDMVEQFPALDAMMQQ